MITIDYYEIYLRNIIRYALSHFVYRKVFLSGQGEG